MDRYKGKYRIPSARLSTWDYSSPGSYFITICTKNRNNFFGDIVEREMQMNAIGRIASTCWAEIPEHFRNTELDEFVVMPNHVHGIIMISESVIPINDPAIPINDPAIVETGHALSLRRQPHPRFRNPGKNTISTMIGSFKSAVTKHSRPINPDFGWQSRFHDHIIRDGDSFNRIARYIRENPGNWKTDRFYK